MADHPQKRVQDIRIQDYTYHLPDERIAKFPLEKRDESRLLIYQNGTLRESIFKEIHIELPPSGLLIFNNTKVIHARILFQRETGANIELFCLEPLNPADYLTSFSSTGTCSWKCLVGNAKRWKGDVLTKRISTLSGELILQAENTGRTDDLFEVTFCWNLPLPFSEVLHLAGILPIPPYLQRESNAQDEDRYQTVYAQHQGSVAAPTAGLHFTPEVFERLNQKGIQLAEVTLHVGAGTFKPVKSETMIQHQMHEEITAVSVHTLAQIIRNIEAQKPIIAVGTTSVRTLESLYWVGVNLLNEITSSPFHIPQWAPYEWDATGISTLTALKRVLTFLNTQGLEAWQGSTQILIAPGYPFKLVDILITNFHQPENTLILLVAAFTGSDWKQIYEYALRNNFRFLSYGDSSLLFRKN